RNDRRYSLRRLARDLGLAHSSLSAILAGKSDLSLQKAFQVAKALELNSTETDYFCLLVQERNIKEEATRAEIRKKIAKLSARELSRPRTLSLMQFRAISEWHPFAILGLASLSGFVFNPSNVATRLGIPLIEAEIAITRLIKLGLLIEDQGRI